MKKEIRKYSSILSISIKDATTYRIELLLWSVIDAMPLIATLSLWLSVYGERNVIAGYTKTALISYYIFGYIFQDLTGSHFEEDALKDIRKGTIASKLIKPFSLKIGLIVREIGWRAMTFLTTSMPVIIIIYFFAKDLITPVGTKYLIILPLFLGMAYLMDTIYSLMITAMGFVFEEANSLSHLKWMLGWLFSGSMMPFEFMPNWLKNIASMLPFQFRYYIPIQIVQGQFTTTEIIRNIFIALLWLLVLVVLLNGLWKRNIKKFTAVGN